MDSSVLSLRFLLISAPPLMQLLSTFLKDLRLLLRDRGEVASLFLMPLAFIIPIALAFPTNGYNLNEDRKPILPVANHDRIDGQPGEHALTLLDALAESYRLGMDHVPEDVAHLAFGPTTCATTNPACDEAVARLRVANDSDPAALIIPAGFSAAISAGEHVSATLLYNPARNPVDRQLVERVVTGSTMRLSIENQVFAGMKQFKELTALAPEVIRENIYKTAEDDAVAEPQEVALAVVAVRPANSRLTVAPNTLQQTIPGYTVMFIYFLIGTVVASIQLERNAGMLRRLQVTPLRRSALLGGKTLAALVVGVLQITAMFAIGRFVFGLDLGNDLPALFVVTVAVVLSAVAIGLAAAAFRIERGINMLVIIGALLAGCAFPADWLPPFLRTINVVLPQTWAMQGYQDLITRGMDLGAVVPEIAVLLGFAGLFFGLAAWRFDTRE